MQLLITSKARDDFDAKVNSALFEGATIVPGTMVVSMTSFCKADGTKFLQSRYAAVVELTPEQTEGLVSARAARAERAELESCDGDGSLGDDSLGGGSCYDA